MPFNGLTRSAKGDMPIVFYGAGLAVFIAAVLPLSHFFLSGIQIFESAHEFISYRIGDAISMMFGEVQNVHPVQGVPSALVSKVLTKILFSFYHADLVTAPVLQLYSALFFAVGFVFLAAVLIAVWKYLTWPERGGVMLMALTPWYLQFPGFYYLFAPEYWFAEYVFLVASTLFLPIVARSSNRQLPVFVGAWVGIGVSTKITLLGIAPIFFFIMPRHSWKAAVSATIASIAAYALVVWAYAGFKLNLTAQIIAYQFRFFIDPNPSLSYADFGEAVTSRPIVLVFVGIAIAAIAIGARKKPVEAFLSALWILLFAYVLWKRPHDSTLASAGLALVFICSRFLPLYGRLISVAVASLIAIMSLNYNKFLFSQKIQRTYHPSTVPDWFKPTGVLFVPSNYWNAAIPLQTFGYNGLLGLHPIVEDGGRLRYQQGGKALQALFGEILVATRIDHAALALEKKISVFWTRPADNSAPHYVESARKDYSDFRQLLTKDGAEVVETCGPHRGMFWCFGVARPKP